MNQFNRLPLINMEHLNSRSLVLFSAFGHKTLMPAPEFLGDYSVSQSNSSEQQRNQQIINFFFFFLLSGSIKVSQSSSSLLASTRQGSGAGEEHTPGGRRGVFANVFHFALLIFMKFNSSTVHEKLSWMQM